MPHTSAEQPQQTSRPQANFEIVGESPVRVWGLPSATRLQRQLIQAGAMPNGAGNRVVLLRADWVYDDPIIRGLVAATSNTALVGAGGECVAANVDANRAVEARQAIAEGRAPAGIATADGGEIAGSYNAALRKREPPYLMRLTTAELPEIEKRIFGGAYKGVTDLVTLYAWPAPARTVTRWCAWAGITPNQVTSLSFLLVLLAMWLFWNGHYVLGLLAAWPMTFLDTVDGKLARVTVTSSKFGNLFDHGIDLLHPPFWWWAWVVGLAAAGLPLANPEWVLWVIIGGYVLQRLEEGIFIRAFGMQIHVWERFDSRFRLITARRNPNMLLLTPAALLGHPDLGILAVAWWTAICLLVHAVRIGQAAVAHRKGPLVSWLSA